MHLVAPIMKRGPIRYNASDFPFPCALLKLPWQSNQRYTRLVTANTDNENSRLALHFIKDFINNMIVEEVCYDPPLYIIRFGWNSFDQFEIFNSVFNTEQVMAIQHFFCIATQNTFLGSARYTIIRANPDNSKCEDDKIFLVHHVVEDLTTATLEYCDIEALWREKLVDRILEFIYNEDRPIHLVIFLDLSQTTTCWSSEHMTSITYFICQITSVVASSLPLKINQPQYIATFQIVVLPNTGFSEGVMSLRRDPISKTTNATNCSSIRSWMFKKPKERIEEKEHVPFSCPRTTNVIEYVGMSPSSVKELSSEQYGQELPRTGLKDFDITRPSTASYVVNNHYKVCDPYHDSYFNKDPIDELKFHLQQNSEQVKQTPPLIAQTKKIYPAKTCNCCSKETEFYIPATVQKVKYMYPEYISRHDLTNEASQQATPHMSRSQISNINPSAFTSVTSSNAPKPTLTNTQDSYGHDDRPVDVHKESPVVNSIRTDTIKTAKMAETTNDKKGYLNYLKTRFNEGEDNSQKNFIYHPQIIFIKSKINKS